MLVSLAMYDAPELRAASDRFYEVWREHMLARGLAAPPTLCWDQELSEIWRHPELLVAQTCGFPFVSGSCGDAQLVVTPCYDAPGCSGPYYRSVLVAHTLRQGHALTRFKGQVAAVNSWDSFSGFISLRAHLVAQEGEPPFFSSTRITGSHWASLQALAAKRADLAAIDCVTWAHAKRLEPALTAQLCEVGLTEPAPGLPLITRGTRTRDELARLRESLRATLEDARSAGARGALGLVGSELLAMSDYQHIHRQSVMGAQMAWP